MCEEIKPWIEGREHMVFITGDASGKNRIAGARGHVNHYQIIQEELRLKNNQFQLFQSNPHISDSRVFCNSLFQKFPSILMDASMVHSIKDLKFVQVGLDNDGDIKIKKKGTNPYLQVDNETLGHLLDCIRYGLHATLAKWITIPKS